MKIFAQIFLPIIFALCVCPSNVTACICSNYGEPACSAIARSDLAFSGKIENIVSAMGEPRASRTVESDVPTELGIVRIIFKTDKVFKGDKNNVASVYMKTGDGCGYEDIRKGQKWMIFATIDRESGLPFIWLCSRSHRVDSFDEDVPDIKPPPPTAIYVTIYDYTFKNASSPFSVQLRKHGKTVQKTTVSQHYVNSPLTFAFHDIEPGDYTISISVTLNAWAGPNEVPIESEKFTDGAYAFEYSANLADGGCSFASFEVYARKKLE